MKIKIGEQYLQFPKVLPNDLESFLIFYPNKFPLIVPYYKEVAKKIAGDPEEFKKYGNWAHDELFAGFEKIKKDYENGDQSNLDFLVKIDQRFNKLICYRFWIVNYLFPDGPIHDFYVEVLKNSIRKFTDVSDEVEEFEGKITRIQRDLLQSDYADLYLQQALNSVELYELLASSKNSKSILSKAEDIISHHKLEDAPEINVLWDDLVTMIKDETNNDPTILKIKDKLQFVINQAIMRKSNQPIYNMLTQAVEFRKENEELFKRHGQMGGKLDVIFSQAKDRLDAEEFKLFQVAYEQSRNFAMFKDVMGEIDRPLLPLWFGLHDKVKAILTKDQKVDLSRTGHACMFYRFVWYLPAHLKDEVMKADMTPFDLKTI
ncbi:MAG: hypothetical protein WCV92_00285 [Candidatus Buchananbacteria bacterium]